MQCSDMIPNIFPVDNCDALAFADKRPRSDGRTRAAAENHQIKFFRLRLLENMGGWRVLCALHATFLSERRLTLGLH